MSLFDPAPVPAASSIAQVQAPAPAEDSVKPPRKFRHQAGKSEVEKAPKAPKPQKVKRPKAPRRRVGRVTLSSALGYSALWGLVFLGLWCAAFYGAYWTLSKMGVILSLSKSLSSILSKPLPASGVLPWLTLHSLWPYALVIGVMVSFMVIIAGVLAALIHNTITRLTGGLVIRGQRPPRPTA